MNTRSEARTGFWVLADQVASSGTTFGGSALAAGLLSAGDFGAWSIAFTAYVLLLSALRTWCGDTLMLLLPPATDVRRLVAGALGLALTVGGIAAVVVLAIGSIPTGTTGRALLGLGICLPGLLVQDATRMSLLAQRNGRAAFVNDGTWLLLTTAALMALRLTDTASTFLAMLAWGLPSYVGALLGLYQLRAFPSARLLPVWLRSTRRLSVLIFAEWVVFALSSVLMLQVVLSFMRDVETVGAVRGALVIMGPITVFFAATTTYSLPLMVRAFHSGAPYVSIGVRQSGVNAAAVVLWFIVASLIPRSAGVRLFGATWDSAQDRLVPIAVALLAAGIGAGAITVLRSSDRLANSLRANALQAVVIGGTTLVVALTRSPNATIWAFSTASVLGPVILWSELKRSRSATGFSDTPKDV